MTLRQAMRVFPRPWIDGNVTFKEWLLAAAVLEAVIAKDEAASHSAPAPLPAPTVEDPCRNRLR